MTTATQEHPRTTTKTSTGTVSVKLDTNYRERLRTLATSQRRTPHFLMKEAIQEYVTQAEIRQNFIRAGEASLADFEATGLHITHDEYTAWRASLRTPNPQAMPVCHA
jgi:predicted transcriptional regulator